MASMLQSGLDISSIITHEMSFEDFEQGFDIMNKGKVEKDSQLVTGASAYGRSFFLFLLLVCPVEVFVITGKDIRKQFFLKRFFFYLKSE